MLSTLESNKGFTVILLGGAIVLLILATAGLDSQLLVFVTPPTGPNAIRTAAVDHYQELFTPDYFTNFVAGEKERDVFATTYFAKPKPAPKPKPPGTRSVSLTFMGSMEASNGEVTAFLSVDNQLRKLQVGGNIVDDWHLAGVANQTLTLTNAEPRTNVIGFEKTLKLDVPIR